MPYWSLPQGSVDTGTYFRKFSATELNVLGSIMLLTYGPLNAIWRPALHAGDANAVKSPASMAAVGA